MYNVYPTIFLVKFRPFVYACNKQNSKKLYFPKPGHIS